MTFEKDDAPQSRRGYHHGNLRGALIKAALELIAEKGLSGFTFAEAARAAGVSPAAPYRHYRDRDGLMADVACRGFEAFEALLKLTWANATPTPVKALKNVSDAYLHFARREPAQFAAMFETGLSFEVRPVHDGPARASAAGRCGGLISGSQRRQLTTLPLVLPNEYGISATGKSAMPFHLFRPPPPHLLPIVLSSALAFAGAIYVMSRNRMPARVRHFSAKVRDRLAGWRGATERPALASWHMISRGAGGTGNTAFDDYRADTLRKLEGEAAEFRTYLIALRSAQDGVEFEAFLKARKQIGGDSGAI